MARTAREILDCVDRLRKKSDKAEYVRTMIRLDAEVCVRKGRLGWRRKKEDPIKWLTEDETNAVYDALAKVRDDNHRWADEEEAKVQIKEGQR